MASSPRTTRADATRVAPLAPAERGEAVDFLRRDARRNLFLIDLIDPETGRGLPGEPRPRILVARRGSAMVAVVSQRPTVVLDAGLSERGLQPFLPRLAGMANGLVRSPSESTDALWRELSRRGRRALVDRRETAFLIEPEGMPRPAVSSGVEWRAARTADLPALVEAARASLREEGRPDPFDGDPEGFRRWVRARVSRARVGVEGGRIVFVGYADVRRPEGWLLQGIYTWPDRRRRGLGRAGVAELCRDAFESGAEHVQLSVVEGNVAAVELYRQLGFRSFASLRTLLFV